MRNGTFKSNHLNLIATDIDGTLVNEEKMLTSRTKQVIQCLKDHDIEFALASGRPLDELDCLIERWGCGPDFFTYLIGMNGGQLKDCHTGISEAFFKIDPVHLKEIVDIMSVFDVNPCVYYHGNVLCKRVDERVLFQFKGQKNKRLFINAHQNCIQNSMPRFCLEWILS